MSSDLIQRLLNDPGRIWRRLRAYQDAGKLNFLEYNAENPEGLLLALLRICLSRNETGDAELLHFIYENRYLHALPSGTWYCWADHHWELDTLESRRAALLGVAGAYRWGAGRINIFDQSLSQGERQRLLKQRRQLENRAFKLLSRRRQNEVLRLAGSGGPWSFSVDESRLDSNLNLLGCKNGVIQLDTGEFRPGMPEDFITRAIATPWPEDDAGDGPLWHQTLREIFNRNAGLIKYLQKLVGYSLLGTQQEKLFSIWVGDGNNGKSFLFRLFTKLFKPLAISIDANILLVDWTRRAGGASPELARLYRTRLVFCQEPQKNRWLNESAIKLLTGGDRLTARGLFQDIQEFDQTHTVFMSCNELPRMDSDSQALWNRIAILPFRVTFVDPKLIEDEGEEDGGTVRPVDGKRLEKLVPEFPYILRWAVEGIRLYLEEGLIPPDEVQEATKKARNEFDIIQQFADDKLEFAKGAEIAASELYRAFREWAINDQGIAKPFGPRSFSHRFLKKYPKVEKVKRSSNFYRGVCFADDASWGR